MPYTRAARPRAIEDEAEAQDLLWLQKSTSNIGWNDYPGWDLPELAYHPQSPAWFPMEGVATSQPQSFIDTDSPAADDTYGLQPWYPAGMQEFSSTRPPTRIRPQLSGSEFISFKSTSLDEEREPVDQSYAFQPCSPNISHQLSSVCDGTFIRLPSDEPTVDIMQEMDDASSHSSKDEDTQGYTARADAGKKRKTTHSIVEKKYRTRLNDSMAKLRHCIPSTARGKFSLDFERLDNPHSVNDTASNFSSGKVATLSDAVRYVKVLELENESLHGRLDVMQRRNNMLQEIALSKADTNMPAMSNSFETCSDEPNSTQAASRGAERQNKEESRVKAVVHSPSLDNRRGSGAKSVTGTLEPIKICVD